MPEIELLKHQDEFLFHSNEKYVLLCGGIGSGKSWAGSHYIIKKCVEDGSGIGLITANTYKQLTNSTLACLFQELDRLDIPYTYKQNKGQLTIMNSELLCLSLESYDYIRGIECGYFWCDEVRDTKLEAFLVLMGRLRDKRTKNLEGRLTTSPSGYNWLYDYFEGEKKTYEFKMINADSRTNTFLPDGYIQTLLNSYDPKMVEQEVQGRFVNISSGKVYYAFDRNKSVGEFSVPNSPAKGGCDFNVDPITGVIAHYANGVIYVSNEIYKRNSNSYELAAELYDKYGGIDIYPDATGKARKTSAVATDHEILRKAGLNVMRTSNPHVRDRHNCVNGLLAHGRLIIHPRCKMLIKDLELLTYENKDSLLSHISDALGYLVWGLEPLQKRGKVKIGSYA